MSKYDEFDLDLKQDISMESQTPNSLTGKVCEVTIDLSINFCVPVSKALDCTSRNSDCSDTRSACSPCGSGYAAMARC